MNVFVNKKTEDEYLLVAIALDATNKREGARVVVYYPIHKPEKLFVRDEDEFREKFRVKHT